MSALKNLETPENNNLDFFFFFKDSYRTMEIWVLRLKPIFLLSKPLASNNVYKL